MEGWFKKCGENPDGCCEKGKKAEKAVLSDLEEERYMKRAIQTFSSGRNRGGKKGGVAVTFVSKQPYTKVVKRPSIF